LNSPAVALINEAAADLQRLTPTITPDVIHNETAENVTSAVLAAL